MAEQRVTQQVVEVLLTAVVAARVTQQVLEVLEQGDEAPATTTRQPVIQVVT